MPFFSFFLGASFLPLPKISLYFFESNCAIFVHIFTSPNTCLNWAWLTKVVNQRFTLPKGARKESSITCWYSMTIVQAGVGRGKDVHKDGAVRLEEVQRDLRQGQEGSSQEEREERQESGRRRQQTQDLDRSRA